MAIQLAKVRLAEIASRQFGRLTWAQITGVGLDRSLISLWIRRGHLHPKLPGVYALGHDAPSTEGDLAAAVLYAGPGAMLSHGTAAWWFGLIDRAPRSIHVSTPRRRRSRPGVTVHRARACARTLHRRLPVTTVAQ